MKLSELSTWAGSGLYMSQLSIKHDEAALSSCAAHIWNKVPEGCRLETMPDYFYDLNCEDAAVSCLLIQF